MENIMVCVTKQRTCQRLIDYGKTLMGSDDTIHIIHVTGSDYNFLGDSEENKALEFLYEKAREAGAVLKSDDTISTLCSLAKDNEITKMVVGASGEAVDNASNFLAELRAKLDKAVELIIVPSEH